MAWFHDRGRGTKYSKPQPSDNLPKPSEHLKQWLDDAKARFCVPTPTTPRNGAQDETEATPTNDDGHPVKLVAPHSVSPKSK